MARIYYPEFTKSIQEVTQVAHTLGPGTEKRTTKVKFYSRLEAIEKLAKHLGFYERDNEQSRIKIELPYDIKIESRAEINPE